MSKDLGLRSQHEQKKEVSFGLIGRYGGASGYLRTRPAMVPSAHFSLFRK